MLMLLVVVTYQGELGRLKGRDQGRTGLKRFASTGDVLNHTLTSLHKAYSVGSLALHNLDHITNVIIGTLQVT